MAAVPGERQALDRQLEPPIELGPAAADPAVSARQRQSAGRWRGIAAVLVSVFVAYRFTVVVKGWLRAIPSLALCPVFGLAVTLAMEAARAGLPLEAVLRLVRGALPEITMLGSLSTVAYVARRGRAAGVAADLGDLSAGTLNLRAARGAISRLGAASPAVVARSGPDLLGFAAMPVPAARQGTGAS